LEKSQFVQLSRQASIIKALAHPSRLFIVQELSKGERCVCKFTELIGADMSTISRHLAVLRNAGIIVDEKRGNQVFYSLKCPCVLEFLGCIDRVMQENVKEQMSCCEI
jgi:ArsR family transcriptional regulator